MRITAFATNTTRGQLADLELRHRRRARCADRIRLAKDPGLRNLPLASFAANRIWCAVVALAAEITAWMQMLALHGHNARRWEPKKLRYRLFTIPATAARTGRRVVLHLSNRSPWADLTAHGLTRLAALAPAEVREPVPTTLRDPGPGTGAHPGRHRADVSHPRSAINVRRQQNCPRPQPRPPRERSRRVARVRSESCTPRCGAERWSATAEMTAGLRAEAELVRQLRACLDQSLADLL